MERRGWHLKQLLKEAKQRGNVRSNVMFAHRLGALAQVSHSTWWSNDMVLAISSEVEFKVELYTIFTFSTCHTQAQKNQNNNDRVWENVNFAWWPLHFLLGS